MCLIQKKKTKKNKTNTHAHKQTKKRIKKQTQSCCMHINLQTFNFKKNHTKKNITKQKFTVGGNKKKS